MKSSNRVVLSLAVAAVLSACSAAPPRNEALETARVMIPEVEQPQVFPRQRQDFTVQPRDGRIGTKVFHGAAAPAVLQEGHRDRLDALSCDQVVHDRRKPGALQVIVAIVNDQ